MERLREVLHHQRLDATARPTADRLPRSFVAVSAAFTAALGGFVRSFLYDVSPLDPLIYGVAASVLITVALLACWLPAWRASRTDPIVALRYE